MRGKWCVLVSVSMMLVGGAHASAQGHGGSHYQPPPPLPHGGAPASGLPIPASPAPKQPKPNTHDKPAKDKPRDRAGVRHVFPLRGWFTFGDQASRFGARREDHRHQGHDLPARFGTPVVAVTSAQVIRRGYQARGAGYFLVLYSPHSRRSYAYMHLRRGSLLVVEGQRVRRGQRIAQVGTSGTSTGPHLHFELWRGRWPQGRPLDPLPSLRRWLGS